MLLAASPHNAQVSLLGSPPVQKPSISPLQLASLASILHEILTAASQPFITSHRIHCHLHRPPIASEPILWNESSYDQPTCPAVTSWSIRPVVDLIASCPTLLVNAIIGEYPRLGYSNLTYPRHVAISRQSIRPFARD